MSESPFFSPPAVPMGHASSIRVLSKLSDFLAVFLHPIEVLGTVLPINSIQHVSSRLRPYSPRRTLTDSDRRRMCQYPEENPSVKQTEIGGEK
jgi:hypothetical protein